MDTVNCNAGGNHFMDQYPIQEGVKMQLNLWWTVDTFALTLTSLQQPPLHNGIGHENRSQLP